MKCAVLFSGGKDSVYAAYLAKEKGYDLTCLITIVSKNPESYMFHTPSITKVKKQAEVMDIPLIIQETKGKKEEELIDLEKAIKNAIEKYEIKAIVTGAIESKYQKSRIEKITNKLDLKCLNPLWKKNQLDLLEELIKNKFDVVIIGVFAYPLDNKWLGRKIDKRFINDMKKLYDKYKINPGGEGGETESYVLNCPLFKRNLEIKSKEITGNKNSWKMEIEIK